MINLFGSVKRITGFGGNLEPNRVYSNPKPVSYTHLIPLDMMAESLSIEQRKLLELAKALSVEPEILEICIRDRD